MPWGFWMRPGLQVFLDLLPSSFHESRAVKKVLTRKLLMQGDLNASFFTLVVELLRVEVTLLLRDALVPRPSNRTAEQHNLVKSPLILLTIHHSWDPEPDITP